MSQSYREIYETEGRTTGSSAEYVSDRINAIINASDSEDFKVGGVDTDGVVLVPVGHINQYGVWIDTNEKTYNSIRPNLWLAEGSGINSGRNILLLRTLAPDGTAAKAGHNNTTVYRTNGIENLVNAPDGFSGNASIWVTTIGAQCHIRVIEASSGRAAYNYTHNTVGSPVQWEGWKKEPYINTTIDAKRILKAAIDGQGLEAAKLGENQNGSMWLGEEPIEYPQAAFSIDGRVAGHHPLFDNDFATLYIVKQLINTLQTKADAQVAYNYLLSLLQTKANQQHQHLVSDIQGLVDELDKFISKQVLGGGKAYDVLARNESGLPILLDTRNPYIGIVTLPRAIQGTAYSYTIPSSLFNFPSGVHETFIGVDAADSDINFGGWSVSDGALTFSFTPSTDGYRTIVVTLKWRFGAQDLWRSCQHILVLFIEPTGTTISTPTAPTGLSATVDGTIANKINLTWTDASSNEEGFNIYRKLTSGGTYAKIATTAASVTSYSDNGLSYSTDYTYKVAAFNGSGESSGTEDNAVTGAQPTTITEAEDVASRRARKIESTSVPVDPTPPSTDFYGNGKPLINIGFQSVTYLQSSKIQYRHKTTGQVRTFDNIDQNNNPSRELPDSNWEIIAITDYDAMLERTASVNCNFLTFLARWPMLQLTETRYNFEPITYLLAKAKAKGIKISIAVKPDIGNGGLPDRAGFGHDQSANWRYLVEDCMKAQRFAGDNGSTTETFYPSDLTPNLLSNRFITNFIKLWTALVNHISNDPNKDVVSSLHVIIGNTGESHMPIDNDRYCDASQLTMQSFKDFVNASYSSLFSNFIANWSNEGNASARGFMRSGGDTNDKQRHRIWQWWLQYRYFRGISTVDIANSPFIPGALVSCAQIARSKGFEAKTDHGSFLDMMAARGNAYALEQSFTQYYDVIKHNPAGTRTGYVETAALKATGKKVFIEWTPGALNDFGGNIEVAIATITTATKQTIDAGADGVIFSFVVADPTTFSQIAVPIINNLKASGHFTKPKQVFTPQTIIDVNIPTQIDAGGWYNSGGPDAQMVAGVNANGGGSSTTAIQKYGFRIQPTTFPTI